ncbi:MAG: PIG-L family deacetylase [Limimaricola sp.]|uniref:PIG-L family deacetylase n=1 Tax=Limimaricola sp. TaxID=2211665 RepID=UPI001DE731A3|nr:PIG-L family deacetylase [Limimaricola sp.]MBI1416755.1 PIG-L family deacetylase [Limimaricola sp.]
MPLSPRDRITRQTTRPRALMLWRALQPLRSVVSFMNTGAHPDDETTAMLAVLGLRDGLQLSYACSTRGEGGQNAIGTEVSEDLGTLRTAEMERAAEVLGMHLYWFARDPADPVHDFGFSKSGEDTLRRWGAERTLARFVEIVRTERPDIICPTFLDVPGQHGHHRAMTATAHLVMDAAADPAFDGCDLPAWQVSKLYLPGWGGGGGSYDDDVPPPPATLTITGSGEDGFSGWTWEQIGQQSRWFHATQGMGAWRPAGTGRDWPLHLARTEVAGPDTAVTSGLPLRLGDLGLPGLAEADRAIDAAIAAFPDPAAVLRLAAEALASVTRARDAAPAEPRHRLQRKEAQLARVIQLAAGVEVAAYLDADRLRPGQSARLVVEADKGRADAITVAPVLPADWQQQDDRIGPRPDAAPSDPYPAEWHPDAPHLPCVALTVRSGAVSSTLHLPLETQPLVLPARSLRLHPATAVLNRQAGQTAVTLDLAEVHPPAAAVSAAAPDGWTQEAGPGGLTLQAPADLTPGLYEVPLHLDGEAAAQVTLIDHPHVAARLRAVPAVLKLRALDVALPTSRVACIGGGSDRVAHWLRAIGLDCEEPTDAALASARPLDGVDTLIVGPFAMRTRPALRAAMPRIHDWVRAGGHLVTLYHRPMDGWDPASVPPLPLTIGMPSLRWRVTDPAAAVTVLVPDHPLLTGPNKIGPADWEGWIKERGLYFASAWDPAYQPLLEMADPGEAPLRGALLSAKIGEGRHSHCALILHYQMEKLVPGAFRLLANLAAGAR